MMAQIWYTHGHIHKHFTEFFFHFFWNFWTDWWLYFFFLSLSLSLSLSLALYLIQKLIWFSSFLITNHCHINHSLSLFFPLPSHLFHLLYCFTIIIHNDTPTIGHTSTRPQTLQLIIWLNVNLFYLFSFFTFLDKRYLSIESNEWKKKHFTVYFFFFLFSIFFVSSTKLHKIPKHARKQSKFEKKPVETKYPLSKTNPPTPKHLSPLQHHPTPKPSPLPFWHTQ